MPWCLGGEIFYSPDLRTTQLFLQPSPGKAQLPVDGGRRDIQRLGDLVVGHAAEEAEFDNLGLAFIHFGQFVEGVFDIEQVGLLLVIGDIGLVQGDLDVITAALLAFFAFGMVDEDLAHGPGGDGDEMGAALPGDAGVDQLEEGLVDQGGGLQSMAGILAAHVFIRQLPQVVVHQWHEFIQRLGITGAPVVQ